MFKHSSLPILIRLKNKISNLNHSLKLRFGASAMKMFLKEYRKMKDQVIKAYTLGESIDDIALEFDMSPDCVKEIVNSYKRTK